jgi:hypothetical protein
MDTDTFLILSKLPLASFLFGIGLGAILCIRKGSNTNVFLSLTLILITSIIHFFHLSNFFSRDKLFWLFYSPWIVGCLITRVRRYRYILYTSQILAALLTFNYLGLVIWFNTVAKPSEDLGYVIGWWLVFIGGALLPSFVIGFAVSASIFARKNKSH